MYSYILHRSDITITHALLPHLDILTDFQGVSTEHLRRVFCLILQKPGLVLFVSCTLLYYLLQTVFFQKNVVIFWASLFNFLNYFVWLRITDEGSVPEMRIWSILLIKSDLKWCIHLSRSLFKYFNYLVSVTAGGPRSPREHM